MEILRFGIQYRYNVPMLVKSLRINVLNYAIVDLMKKYCQPKVSAMQELLLLTKGAVDVLGTAAPSIFVVLVLINISLVVALWSLRGRIKKVQTLAERNHLVAERNRLSRLVEYFSNRDLESNADVKGVKEHHVL